MLRNTAPPLPLKVGGHYKKCLPHSKKKLNICVIGSGFAGISAATYLANTGHNVFILEKNSDFGGRARRFEQNGFTFDMGPSWYWMPDVFDNYFKNLGESIEDYFKIIIIAFRSRN